MTAILIVVIVSSVGTYLLLGSHAASPYASITTDKGTLANGATAQSCTGSSDGSCVRFGGTQTQGTGSINPSPDLPSSVSPNGGSWSVAYGDAFNAPLLNTPQASGASVVDNTWYPGTGSGTDPCINHTASSSHGMELMNCSKVSVDSQGLELTCTYTPGIASGKNYQCGEVQGEQSNLGSAYKLFHWTPGHGETWVFQTVAKFPHNTGEEDVGFWSFGDPTWTDEFDFFESWGWTGQVNAGYTTTSNGTVWVYDTNPVNNIEGYKVYPFDPSAAFHTYTTVIYPNNTYSEYIDGQLQTGNYGYGNGVIGPPPSFQQVPMGLILQYELQYDNAGTNPSAGFLSGSRNFSIQSVSVYQDGAHANQDIINGGLAPGTTVR